MLSHTIGGMILPPDHPDAPKYWSNETGPELRPAMMLYLTGRALTDRQLQSIKAYVAQWVNSSVRSRADLEHAIDLAVELGMDPL